MIKNNVPWEKVFGKSDKPIDAIWRNAAVIVLNEFNGASIEGAE